MIGCKYEALLNYHEEQGHWHAAALCIVWDVKAFFFKVELGLMATTCSSWLNIYIYE